MKLSHYCKRNQARIRPAQTLQPAAPLARRQHHTGPITLTDTGYTADVACLKRMDGILSKDERQPMAVLAAAASRAIL